MSMHADVMSRMTGKAIHAYNRLTTLQQGDVNAFLLENPGRTLCSEREVIEAWLIWNGIIGYDQDIIDLVVNAYGFTYKSSGA